MKIRRIAPPEVRGYCHDCHSRAQLEITFAHRMPIRLCDRCAGFLIADVAAAVKQKSSKPAGD